MKLREYGLIIWKLSHESDITSENVGNLAYEFKDLVEDWAEDNSVTDTKSRLWMQESYQHFLDHLEHRCMPSIQHRNKLKAQIQGRSPHQNGG